MLSLMIQSRSTAEPLCEYKSSRKENRWKHYVHAGRTRLVHQLHRRPIIEGDVVVVVVVALKNDMCDR